MVVEFNKHGSKSTELATTSFSPEKGTIHEENTIVGMEDDFNTILDHLTAQTDELTVIPIFGMGGIGKITLARKVYDDSSIRSRFDKHAWVTISQEYNQRQMLLEVVSSITGSNQEMSDDELMEIVYRGLKGRRFLIVIDDIWSTEAWDQMQRIFPNDDNKSRILLTTRLKYVADYVNCPDFPPHSKSFLSLEDSWNLFTKKIFKKDQCPPLLVELGKHIVQQCQGLPFSIVVVAGLLGKMDDNWKNVEENLNSFFGTVSERCQSILSLSYNYLPQYLKACFLYVAGFPEDREFNVSKLIRLWIAEQLVKARNNKRLEVVAEEYLQELIDRSLILIDRLTANGRMKTFKIHDLLRQLCLSETHTENVVYIMNGIVPLPSDEVEEIILSELQEKEVFPPMHCSGITRTFISRGYYDFPEEICSIVSKFKSLKVLDVLSIEYDFSSVIPELVHLRYVAARIEKALSLDKLRNLQTIILQPIKKEELEQQVDIWRMSELRQLDIRPPLYISNPLEAENPLFLKNLQNLHLCNSPFIAEIIRRTPNLKKLKFIDDSEHSEWPAILDSLILLEELETLFIAIDVNIFSGDILPCKIKKMTLRYRAFDGTNWKVDEDVVFHKLKYLQLYGPYDLERWELAAGSDNFPMLEQLLLCGLDELEEIPESIGDIMTLKFIQIKRCSSGVVNSAKRVQQEQERLGNYDLQLQITPKVFSESRILEYNVTEKEFSPGNKEILIDNKQYYKFLGKDIHMISLIKLYTERGKVVRHEDCISVGILPWHPNYFSVRVNDLETLHIETQGNIDPMIISRDISLPNLNKLKLFRTYIPWEVVNLLANLPNLEVLKGYRAFAGTDWKVDEYVVFHKLKYLQLYGPYDLQRWELAAGSHNFPML
ncbi:hypothetical protein KY285_007198 [Solanum tuberosum]|nr:hypothetical protein KY285_007198 [Solanum tuberosum]